MVKDKEGKGLVAEAPPKLIWYVPMGLRVLKSLLKKLFGAVISKDGWNAGRRYGVFTSRDWVKIFRCLNVIEGSTAM